MNTLRVAWVTMMISGVLLMGGCGSQTDAISRPDIDGNQVANGGIFRTAIRAGDGDSQWIFMFGEEQDAGADNRIVAYRLGDNADEFISGRFVTSLDSGVRRANVLWVDTVEVIPDEDTPEDELPEEPEFERRVRPAVLDVLIQDEEHLLGTLSGEGIDATVDGDYQDAWYERPAGHGIVAGEWRDLDAFGRENISIAINSEGGFGGRTIDDCTLSGQFTAINARFNLYEVIIANLCDETLDATGLASVRPASSSTTPGSVSTLVMVVPLRDGSDILGFQLAAESEPDGFQR